MPSKVYPGFILSSSNFEGLSWKMSSIELNVFPSLVSLGGCSKMEYSACSNPNSSLMKDASS